MKEHYKLYKSGKLWVSAAIIAGVLGLSASVNIHNASANSINDYIVSHVANNGWTIAPEQAQISGVFPKYAYENGVAHPEIIINHETANSSDNGSWIGEKNYMINNYQNAFVHDFTSGHMGTVGIADDRYLAWGAGPTANSKALQIEQVEENDKDGFAAELLNLAGQDVRWLHTYNLPLTLFNPYTGKGVIASHAMTSAAYGETNHTDPNGYWADRASRYFGTTYTMNDFYDLVSKVYNNQLTNNIPKYTQKYNNGTRIVISRNATGTSDGADNALLVKSQSSVATITKVTQKNISNSHFIYDLKLSNGQVIHNVLEQDMLGYSQNRYVLNQNIAIGTWASKNANGTNINSYAGQNASIVGVHAQLSDKSNWTYDIKLDNGTVLYSVLEQDVISTLKVTKTESMNKFATINAKSRVDGIYQNAPYGVAGYSHVADTNSYDGWFAQIMKSETLENGVTYYYVNFNGMNVWVDSRAFTNVRDMPVLTKTIDTVSYNTVKSTASDIRTGDPRWNKKATLSTATQIKNSNSASSLSVKINSIRVYSDGSAYADIYQNNKEIGWININELEKEISITNNTDPTNNNNDNNQNKSSYNVTVNYVDASSGKQIAKSQTLNLKKGSQKIDPIDIADYNSPVSQNINVDADSTITFKYEFKYPELTKYKINVSSLNTAQKSWMESVLPSIITISKENNLYPSVMLAQAAIETGYGQSDLATKANNLFGIKAGGTWTGDSYNKDTQEVVNGKQVTINDNFRKYATLNDGLNDYANKVKSGSSDGKNNTLYQMLYQSDTNNYVIASESLSNTWSTDPNYGDSLVSWIDKYKAYQLDGLSSPANKTAPVSITGIDIKGNVLWTKKENVSLGKKVEFAPKNIDGYKTPSAQSIIMNNKDGNVISFVYAPNQSVVGVDTTKKWLTTHNATLYSDDFLTNKVGIVNGNITIDRSETLASGILVYHVSQNNKDLGWILSNDASKIVNNEPTVTVEKTESTTKWLKTINSNATLYSDNLLSKSNGKISGNFKVSKMSTLSNKNISYLVSQNGKELGWINSSDTQPIAPTITSTEVKTRWGKITSNTNIYKDDLGINSIGNTSDLKYKNITVKKTVSLSNNTKLINIFQNGKELGWINISSSNL